MKVRKTDKKKVDEVLRFTSIYPHKESYPDRRQLEMNRRFGLLQSKRSYLERELKAVKACLVSLDKQMQSYAAYKQLSNQR